MEYAALIAIGFVAGMLFYHFFLEEEEKIEQLPPKPITLGERRIVTVNTMFMIPLGDIADGVSKEYIQKNIAHELAKQIWPYAIVCAEDNGMYQERIYHARVKVVDMGQLNPFAERRAEDGK